MATQNDSSRTFPANVALSQFRRVTLSSNGGVGLADNIIAGVGIVQRDTTADDPYGAIVRLSGAGSYAIAVTAAPVTAGNLLYAALNGYAAPTGTVSLGLRAAENTTVNGSVIEAIPSF
jgi:hypothetical protein